jgi:hypothetical protein
MEEVDVFVTDPTTLDLEVYDLWLKGFTGWLCQYLLCFFFNHHVHVRNKLGGGGGGGGGWHDWKVWKLRGEDFENLIVNI